MKITDFFRPAHHLTFPLLDLPRELRNVIIEFSLEPRADFLHTAHSYVKPGFSLPMMDEDSHEDLDEDEEERRWDDDLEKRIERDPNIWDGDGQTSLLTFRLSFPTPLLRVSAQIRAETQDLLKVLRPRVHEIVKTSIHTHRIVDACPMFLDICTRSCFFFSTYAEDTLFWLKRIPEEMRPCVRDIVMMDQNLFADDEDTAEAWAWINNNRKKGSLFTHVICDTLPNLRSIGLQLDESSSFAYLAPGLCCDMLKAGKTDIVRLISRPDHDEDRCMNLNIEELVGTMSQDSAVLDDKYNYIQKRRKLDAIREITPSNVDQHPEWSWLDVEEVVKITRWSDTRLGTSTYMKIETRKIPAVANGGYDGYTSQQYYL
ncbi:hypothetical protein BDV95DRAFT_608387 [Massariosphaeria phaeospora]|uniref:Uncharacterized protein n=1 Tax=Massariosphaeria phaeospora TaxID=100035 RepID=A0A7C8I435_9PLEO|nr:hypothetical protein BDV95DRAFT_608387 [Massariosphaeria phaeospora]